MSAERLPLARAINAGLRRALERDPKVLIMGEDVGPLGGVFRVTDGLQETFGADRVIDTPLAESGIVGTAIGLAMGGYRPVCEIQFDGFIFPAYDQITTQLAKLHYRTAGVVSMPVVIRVPYGGHIGAIEHHSESPEALFAHTAGLRIVSPATPQDGFVMIQQAIASPDPVLFFEPKSRYWDKAEVNVNADDTALGLLPLPDGSVPAYTDLHRAKVVRPGQDLTLVAYGPSVSLALSAAEAAAAEGLSLEVIDLRSVSPIDFETITASVRRTGRLIVLHEAPTFFGVGAEIAARVSELCFYHLQAPVQRVGGFHSPFPASNIERYYLPDVDRVLYAVDTALAFA